MQSKDKDMGTLALYVGHRLTCSPNIGFGINTGINQFLCFFILNIPLSVSVIKTPAFGCTHSG